jgi:cell division protein FtsW
MAIVAVLTLFEPDIGTAVLFTLWTVSMVAIWGGKRGMMYFLTFVVVIVALLLTLALHPDLVKSASVPSVFRHALARIEAWLNPLADPYGVTYQAVKDYRAVYLGGLIGHKVLPYDVPPVPWADTIIPFVVLYLGAIAGYVVLVVLITYALSLLWISKNLTIGSSIFVSGYALLLLWQTIVSSLSSFNILPQTGMSVPYLSWGRTALITFTILGAMSLAAAVWQTSGETEGGEES